MTERLQKCAIICSQVICLYEDMLSSYVSDFYLENHWNSKLSSSWRSFLQSLSLDELGGLLDYERPYHFESNIVVPLSFLCLQNLLRNFAIKRTQVEVSGSTSQCDKEFMKFFWKGVKLKKRHEIDIMSNVCYQAALKTGCFNIVDVGSGLGHLSRLLAYRYGFKVCTIEADSALSKLASKMDLEFERILQCKGIGFKSNNRPEHINIRLENNIATEEFEALVKKGFKTTNKDFKFGIVGLHPCGNLAPTLLFLYNNSSHAEFINLASCCYMKLSFDYGFPLSQFYQNNNYKLDYLLCELACHAIESYIDKVRIQNDDRFKVHSYRAALECLLVKFNDELRHCQINSVKYDRGMSFKTYCIKATQKYKLAFACEDLDYYEALTDKTWKDVVKLYSMRLLIAPLVESFILYDRLLYLEEQHNNCSLSPVFNSKISARNHILSACKNRK